MEVLSKLSNGSIRRYWRRRRYQRLDGTNSTQKNVKLARFGGGRSNKKQYFWRIKAIPKLRLKIFVSAPLKLWSKFKNGYMDMMLSLAGNVGSFNTGNVFGGKRIPKQRQLPVVYSNDEFESRLIFEIYKALIASRELATT